MPSRPRATARRASQNAALQKMFRTRDFLRGYSASANKTVDIYYHWNEEFLKIALADSRVFKLGREILEQAQDTAGRKRLDATWTSPCPEDLFRNAQALVGIIKNEYPDSPLAPLARLADRNLALIGRTPAARPAGILPERGHPEH